MDYKTIKNFSGIQEKVSLKNYTTYKIGGPARWFFDAKNKEDLIKILQAAKKIKMPIFILGGGSNLLISDKGFNGLVVKIDILDTEFTGNKVYVGAGALLPKVAYMASENGLSGLEWSAGVPGTIGGAIYGHAQAFGTKISSIIEFVYALDLKTFKIIKISKTQCKFGLKSSIFKRNKNLIIVSANLIFDKKDPLEIKNKIKEFLEYRGSRHPGLPSAGSTFVNPEKQIRNKKLLESFPELRGFNGKGIIPAGYLISKCGLAGKKVGDAQIAEKHANFIVNLGNAKSKDVLVLIKLAKQKVKKIFNINLELEVQIV